MQVAANTSGGRAVLLGCQSGNQQLHVCCCCYLPAAILICQERYASDMAAASAMFQPIAEADCAMSSQLQQLMQAEAEADAALWVLSEHLQKHMLAEHTTRCISKAGGTTLDFPREFIM